MFCSVHSNEYKVINDYLYINDEYNELPYHGTLIYLKFKSSKLIRRIIIGDK